MQRSSLFLAGMLTIAGIFEAPAATTWTAVILHPDAAEASALTDGSDAGQAGWVVVNGVRHAALWLGSKESFVDLHPPAADSSEAHGVRHSEQVGRVFLDGRGFATTWRGTAASARSLHPADPALRTSEAHGTTGSQQCGWVADTTVRATLWSGDFRSPIDLHPDGVGSSEVAATNGAQQVGRVTIDGRARAAMWTGSRLSHRELHPPGATVSGALGIEDVARVGAQIVGFVNLGGPNRAALWLGQTRDFIDLHPPAAVTSLAQGTDGVRQVGEARFGDVFHAACWSGTADSFIDLHRLLPAGYRSSSACAIWSDRERTRIAGFAFSETRNRFEAILWEEVTIPAPVIALRGRVPSRTTAASVTLRGTALHAARVELRAHPPTVQVARGTTRWTHRVRLRSGRNRILVRAVNSAGEASAPIRVVVHRKISPRR